ncbi:hypothetical protein AMTR_s02169p00007830, partial [Amborella trichopoda]
VSSLLIVHSNVEMEKDDLKDFERIGHRTLTICDEVSNLGYKDLSKLELKFYSLVDLDRTWEKTSLRRSQSSSMGSDASSSSVNAYGFEHIQHCVVHYIGQKNNY